MNDALKAWNQNHAFTGKLLRKRELSKQVDLQQILLTEATWPSWIDRAEGISY